MKILLSYARQLRDRSKNRRSRKSLLAKASIIDGQYRNHSPLYYNDAEAWPPSYRESCGNLTPKTTEKEIPSSYNTKTELQRPPSHAKHDTSEKPEKMTQVWDLSTHDLETHKHPVKSETPRGRPQELLYRSQLSDLRSREPKVPYPRRRVGRASSFVIDEQTTTNLQICLTSWREESITMLSFVVLMIFCSFMSWFFV